MILPVATARAHAMSRNFIQSIREETSIPYTRGQLLCKELQMQMQNLYLLQHYCPSSQAARQWVSFDGRPLTGSFQSSHWLIKEKGYCQKISCNIHMPDALVRKQPTNKA